MIEQLAGWDGLVVDLDGTLVAGRQPLAGAAGLIHAAVGRIVVLSNNSSHRAHEIAGLLSRLGMPVPAEKVVLAGELAVEALARERPGAGVLLATTGALRAYAVQLGLVPVRARAGAVLLARDPAFGYAKLTAIVDALRRGAALLVANPDLVHPGRGGRVVPETGSLLAAVRAAAGDVPVRVIGKPERAPFQEALRRLGTAPERTLVIGDNPLTDGLGAERAGLRFWRAWQGLPPRAPPRVVPAAQYRLVESTSKVRAMVSTARS